MTTCGTVKLAQLVAPSDVFTFSISALVAHLMTQYKKHVPTAATSSTVERINVITAAGGRSYLLGRCVEAPPAGLTGVLRWRRRRLAAEGRVSVRLITSLTFAGLFNISRVHTQPVTAGCKHPTEYTQLHTITQEYTQILPVRSIQYSIHNQLQRGANILKKTHNYTEIHKKN